VATNNLAAVDIGGGVSSAWTAVATFVPKLVAFLVIFLIGWVIARVLGKVVGRLLNKVGFDRVVERGGLKQILDRGSYQASEVIAKVVYYAILLIALEVAFGVFGPNPISDILTSVVAWLPRLIVAMVIIVIVGAIARVVKGLVGGALSGLSYGSMLGTIAAVFIWGLGVIAALNQIGIATAVTTPVLITVLATLGGVVVVGLGGGLIRPMQQRWESWINRAEEQLPGARAHTEAYQRGREDAQRAGDDRMRSMDQQGMGQQGMGQYTTGQHSMDQQWMTPSERER
jgi:cell shape-determining protein MreD